MPPDPFVLLNIDPAFDLDLATLQRAYLSAQQACHPDRFSREDRALRQQAALRSVQVNEAYQTLKSPLLRARALLAAQDILVGGERDTHKPEPALLMAVMEWREAMEEGDLDSSIATLEAAQAAQIETLTRAFAAVEYSTAAQGTLRLQYLEKTLADAKAKRRQLAARI